jgi:hypothetical protein
MPFRKQHHNDSKMYIGLNIRGPLESGFSLETLWLYPAVICVSVTHGSWIWSKLLSHVCDRLKPPRGLRRSGAGSRLFTAGRQLPRASGRNMHTSRRCTSARHRGPVVCFSYFGFLKEGEQGNHAPDARDVWRGDCFRSKTCCSPHGSPITGQTFVHRRENTSSTRRPGPGPQQ